MLLTSAARLMGRTAALVALHWLALAGRAAEPATPPPSGPQSDGPLHKIILDADRDGDGDGKVDDVLVDVMEIAVAKDGRVFYIERAGIVKVWEPKNSASSIVGKLKVFNGLEDGLLGLTLDPQFERNNWLYLFYSLPETGLDEAGKKIGTNRVSRFTLKDHALDLSSEKVLLEVVTQREQCCHSAGSLAFDARGNLYIATGDNTHPGESDGYTPVDERPNREPWNALKSAANANDLRGKILRILPDNAAPNGYRTDGTAREVYLATHPEPEENWRTELQMPIVG